MKVCVFPSDRGGVSHYRLLSVIPHLPYSVETSVQERVQLDFNYERRTVRRVPALGADLIVWHRPSAWWAPQAAKLWQRQGIRIVVDLDDYYHGVMPDNLAHYTINPRYSKDVNWHHLGEMIRLADHVTVSTDELARRYGQGRPCSVLRNMIDGEWLKIRRTPELRLAGWTGTLTNHHGDLKATAGGVADALERSGGRFRVIGSVEGVRQELGLDEDPQHVPWQGMADYPREIAKLAAGIAPLADNAVNRAKSWNKPLEMAACGVPCVMSPMPEYRRLWNMGLGVIAHKRRDWNNLLWQLLTGDVLRESMIEDGRQIAAGLTIQKNAWRWAEAWDRALQ